MGAMNWPGGESIHVNGIEGFWGFARSSLTRFRGMKAYRSIFI